MKRALTDWEDVIAYAYSSDLMALTYEQINLLLSLAIIYGVSAEGFVLSWGESRAKGQSFITWFEEERKDWSVQAFPSLAARRSADHESKRWIDYWKYLHEDTRYTSIEDAMNDPANTGRLFAVVDLGEGEMLEMHSTLKDAEARAERFCADWDNELIRRIASKEKALDEHEEDDQFRKKLVREIAENKRDFNRLNPRYQVFTTEDVANGRDKFGDYIYIANL